GGEMSYVLVNDLKDDHFTARVFIQKDGSTLEVDARPSDAVAVAVRANVPVFVAEKVMDEAGIYPEEDIRFAADKDMQGQHDVFADFLDTLDVDSDE
ncbi:MAG: bifunctional nuclease domain-containing protein, partial [Chloroflexota bacterium]